jgi:hypothetical protein
MFEFRGGNFCRYLTAEFAGWGCGMRPPCGVEGVGTIVCQSTKNTPPPPPPYFGYHSSRPAQARRRLCGPSAAMRTRTTVAACTRKRRSGPGSTDRTDLALHMPRARLARRR